MSAVLAMPAPKFATERDLAYPTRGHLDAKFARVWMGSELLPWHRYVADVAGEYDPATGLPRRSLVVITVQRQAGKSYFAMAKNGRKCFTNPGHRAWYTAQTGQDARDQFLKFYDDTLAGTALQGVVSLKRGNGHESMTFPNGSTMRPHPPTEDAMHGKQSDDNDVDEAWAFPEEHGQLLMQAIGPTQLTRPGAQTWIYSAGGTAESTWLAALVARGRGGDPNIAYFEFGIPDDADPDDLDVIYEHHPAAGHLITMDSLRALRAVFGDDRAGWARAAGNIWTEVIGGGIPADVWRDAQTTLEIPAGVPVGWGAARATDGSHVAIAAATELPGGHMLAELVDVVPSYDAAARVKAWAAGATVAVSPSGPSAGLSADLTRITTNTLATTDRTAAAACLSFSDGLEARMWQVRTHADLDAAVSVAGKRRTAGGGFVWAPTGSGFPIAALEAVTWATHAVRNRVETSGTPVDRWAS